MSSKTTNKGVAWLYNEVCALLDIWADQEIQLQLAGRLHNMCVYDKISKRLADLGIDRTGEQCREKIKKLRRDYKTVVDNNYSPAFARKLLGCYDKVHEIFGKSAVLKPSFVIESIVYNENINQKDGIEAEESSSETIITESKSLQSNKQHHSINRQITKSSSSEFSDSSKASNKKDSTNFRNFFETTKVKSYSESNKIERKQQKRRKLEKHVEKQTVLFEKLSRKQTALHKRLVAFERKKHNNELAQERKKINSYRISKT